MVQPRVWQSFLALAVVLSVLSASGEAFAFHDGGAGACEGCHTMHNSLQGASMTTNAAAPGYGNAYLLRGGDPSSTCLNCHQHAGDVGPTTYHVSTPMAEMPTGVPPKQMSPGGDFGWLRKTFSWIPAAGQPITYSNGERHGHNIVSSDYGYLQDATHSTAPGGSYPASALGCISCHDPHGKFRRNVDGSVTTTGKPVKGSGSFATSAPPDAQASVGGYRLLGGTGYMTPATGVAYAFINPVPAAVAPLPANRSEESSVTRVAYGSGMSQWCKNCHTNIHDATFPGGLSHVSDTVLSSTIVANYNRYVKTGDVSGTDTNAYSSLVPFEIGNGNYDVLRSIVSDTPTRGAETSDGTPKVMCLSCHRAHASGWDSATRWNSKTDYIVSGGAYSQQYQAYQPYGQGRTEVEALAAYYNTPATNFAYMQKSLCNKCHVNDLN